MEERINSLSPEEREKFGEMLEYFQQIDRNREEINALLQAHFAVQAETYRKIAGKLEDVARECAAVSENVQKAHDQSQEALDKAARLYLNSLDAENLPKA